jgi:hypothetical protein
MCGGWSQRIITRMTPTIVLRNATDADVPALRQLAALDDAPALDGDILIASVDGDPVAALSLADGRVAADPFRLTENAIALLRVRADHLAGRRPRRRVWPRLRPRLA